METDPFATLNKSSREQVINSVMIRLALCLSRGILYIYVYMIHYKSLISILSIYNYVTSSHAMTSFSIEKIFLKI
jgi:hypothetical protein